MLFSATGLSEGYALPTCYALVLHLLLLAVLIGLPRESLESVTIEPRSIKASLVSLPAPRAKTTQEKVTARPQPQEPIPEPQTSPVIPKEIVESPEPVTPAEDKPVEPLDQGIDPSLDDWLAEEAAEIEAEEEQELRERYAMLIRNRVHRVWNIPPSARRQMEVLLLIRLLPRGDVVAVTVLEGSGNAALDRSAVTAVKKIERFSEVREMEPRFFEAHFREFEMRFRPENLRL